jgi:nitroreductase
MSFSTCAKTDHPIHDLLSDRWSPTAFSNRPVADEDLRSIFEAARWTASTFNEQPWRYILATRADHEGFDRLLSCLDDANAVSAKEAPVLVLCCTRLTIDQKGQPNTAAEHDLGAASASLTLEATSPPDDRHPARQASRVVRHSERRQSPDGPGHRLRGRPGRVLERDPGAQPRTPAAKTVG